MKIRIFAIAFAGLCAAIVPPWATGDARAQSVDPTTLIGWCQDAQQVFTGMVGMTSVMHTDQRRSNATACAAYLRGWLEHETYVRAQAPQLGQCTRQPANNAEMVNTFLTAASQESTQDINQLMKTFGGHYCQPLAIPAPQPSAMIAPPAPQAQLILSAMAVSAPPPLSAVLEYVIAPRVAVPRLPQPEVQLAAVPETHVAPEVTEVTPAPPATQGVEEVVPPQVETKVAGTVLEPPPAPVAETQVAEDVISPRPATKVAQVMIVKVAPDTSTKVAEEIISSQPQTTGADAVIPPPAAPEAETKVAEEVISPAPPEQKIAQSTLPELPPVDEVAEKIPSEGSAALPLAEAKAPKSVLTLKMPPARAAKPVTPEEETARLIAALAGPDQGLSEKPDKKAGTRKPLFEAELKRPVTASAEPPPLIISYNETRKLSAAEQSGIQIIR